MPITITGMDKVIKQLDQLGKLEKTLGPVLKKNQKKIQEALKKYPPPPPNSSYVRTEKLKRSWRTPPPTFTGGGAYAWIVADGTARTKYGRYDRYVMDAEMQATIHRGRWHTTKSVENDFRDKVVRDIKREIERALK
jgi:hypothetical protein